MMIARVPPPALSDLHPGLRLAGPARPVTRLQERGAARAAARGRRAALAPPPGHPEMDLPEPDRTAAGQRRGHRADRAARHREPQLGGPADPGRAAHARPPGRRVHDPPGSQGAADPAGSEAAHRYDRLRDLVVELANAECGFGYRTSAFKMRGAGRPGAALNPAAATGRFVVLSVSRSEEH